MYIVCSLAATYIRMFRAVTFWMLESKIFKLPQAINDALEGTGAPVQVVSGYLGRVTISVPWSALMSESCRVEVSGLTLSVMPCISSLDGEDLGELDSL